MADRVRRALLEGPLKALRAHVRSLETMQDMKPVEKMKQLEALQAGALNGAQRAIITLALRRARAASKKARHPVFFKVDRLIRMAFSEGEGSERDRLVLQLRLTTLMRSVDLKNLVWGIFHADGKWFLRTVSKTGAPLVFSVTGETLGPCTRYMQKHADQPAEIFSGTKQSPGRH